MEYINKYTPNNFLNEKLIFLSNKDGKILLFSMEHYRIITDIIRYYLSQNSRALKICNHIYVYVAVQKCVHFIYIYIYIYIYMCVCVYVCVCKGCTRFLTATYS